MLGCARHLATLVLDHRSRRTRRAFSAGCTANRRRRAAHWFQSRHPGGARSHRARRRDGFAALIEGESGSGKELVARQIHDLSVRRNGPFVAVNCAAIVETLLEAELFGIEERTATGVRGRRGKFEHAHEGTLFLDEVSDLSLAAQAKLLRAIQELSVERVGGDGSRASTSGSSRPRTSRSRTLVARGGSGSTCTTG